MGDEMVERVKTAVDIVEIVGDSVRLTKKGRNFSGLCPFHEEKTPSFVVSPERQAWHCFGCGKGGDVLSFVMEREGLSFPEALEMLATRAGITLPQRRRRDDGGVDLYGIMEQAADLYQKELQGPSGKAARAYLERRNISETIARRFELGWAPNAWQFLSDRLKSSGVKNEGLLKAGLSIEGERGLYDRFRGRVMFPVRNVSGRVIAFGGRILEGEGAKYVNSPEGPLYAKKSNLYLLDKAKGAIREKSRSILVEGYMDALRLHIHGWSETVASLGTALTEEQAALLRRFANRCYICYDSDAAGQDAALKGMYVLQKAGLSVFVITLPLGKDPDEMLQSDGGGELFQKALDSALPLVRHHVRLFQIKTKTEGAARAGEALLRDLSTLSALELAPYLQELSQALSLPDYQLLKELERCRFGKRASGTVARQRPEPARHDEERVAPPDRREAALIYLLWSSSMLRAGLSAADVTPYVQDSRLQAVVMALLSGASPSRLEAHWLEMGETFPLSVVAAGGAYCETLEEDLPEKWPRLCHELKGRNRMARFQDLKGRLLRGEATDSELEEYAHLARELKS